MDGSFEDIPGDAAQYDVVWSQDAILHSGRRETVISEVVRVLKPGGLLIFTDPMAADDCPQAVLQPVLDRIHLDSLGSVAFYDAVTARWGMEPVHRALMTEQLVNHYSRVLQEVQCRYQSLQGVCSREYLDRMQKGLQHWIDAGNNGHLAWGILVYRKVV
ncbi:MAG: methyltransferase domain-containing protein [Candidatus Competibacterales bacterium]